MKKIRKIIQIDEELCDGCGQCIIACAEGALAIVDGKARVISDNLCDGLGACLGECPTGALEIIEREAEDFDEEAVEEHLVAKEKEHRKKESISPCGCPSGQIEIFNKPLQDSGPGIQDSSEGMKSALSHWPVQIMLVPPQAPFLKGADLLVVADCAPLAYPNFHRDFLKGKVVMMGCPKFDDVQMYIEKFAEIFKTAQIKSVTAVVMEVPCCSGMPIIIKRGMEKANKNIPLREVVIGTQGKILKA